MSDEPRDRPWSHLRLGDIAKLITKGTTPNHLGFDYQDNGITFLKVECISGAGGFIPTRFAYIDGACHNALLRSQLQVGDLLYSIAGALGRRAIVYGAILPANTNQALAIIRLGLEANLDRQYLFHFLVSPQIRNQIERFAVQSAQANLSLANVNDFVIDAPPLPEQRKIASILTTVDSLIEQTEALIEKYRRVKQGMMADLLSRGVDSDGKLRPTQQQAPELYKQSELGFDSLPIDWEEGTIADFCDLHNSLRFPISEEIRSSMQGEYSYYGPTGILDYINEYRVEGRYVLIGEDGDHFLKFDRQKMTIVIEGRCNVNNHAHILSGRIGCTTDWIDAFFSHRDITLHVTQQGAGRLKLNKASLLEMPMLVPPEPEQQVICRRIREIVQRIQSEESGLAKLRTLKTGLMQDLLTGKVRVKVDEAEEAPTSG